MSASTGSPERSAAGDPDSAARPRYVLDASALVAYLKPVPEVGAGRVRRALEERAAISTVNLAEVYVEIAAEKNTTPDAVREEIETALPQYRLRRVPFDEPLAADAARIERFTRGTTIGLADRACLALGRLLGARVLTADGAWVAARRRHPKLRVAIEDIRTP